MKRIVLLAAGLLSLCYSASAFRERDIKVMSESMNKEIPVTVITPEGYESGNEYPVIYLLHGHSGDHRTWTGEGIVGKLADRYGIMMVLPDGGYNSWYFDSPVTPEFKYETFVSKELIEYIDSNYKTIKDRSARAITGLSMGGHGALYLAFRHPDIFGSAGSTSGGVDFRPFPENWELSERLGTYEDNPENWENNTVINMTHLIKPGQLNLIIDCGTEDFFYEVNCNFHKKLLKKGIPHEFHVRPGVHWWTYWRISIQYQILFFKLCFDNSLTA